MQRLKLTYPQHFVFEYDYADALGARLLTDIPVDGKETVTIRTLY